jgi:dipeptidyl aminopeptidase/acylaminoacyl peptidase
LKKSNKSKTAAPCGTWVSPLSAEDATGSNVGLQSLHADGQTLYWLEGRPTENGRTALVRKLPGGNVEDVTPSPINVASRAHEYGGGSYTVDDGRVIYCEKTDGSVWMVDGNEPPRKIASVDGCRYADFRFIPDTNKIVCIREDHRDRPPTDPEASIVVLDTDKSLDPKTNEGHAIIKGADFLSSPRVSPDGSKIAWISWKHPDMPWDATKLHVAKLSDDKIEEEKIIAGDKQREAIVQPEWSPSSNELHFCSDRNDWWNIYRLDANENIKQVSKVTDGEIGGPHWVFGLRFYDFLPDGNIIATLSRNGSSQGVSVEQNGSTKELQLPKMSGCPVILEKDDGSFDWGYIKSGPDSMPAIGVTSHDSGGRQDQIIRKSGPEILGKEHISIPQEISFPTADGEKAHAFFYAPVNANYKEADGEKPPLIVMIHGGPTSCASSSFSQQIQWWTTRGFAVADVNYRGSTGYGRAYREKLNDNWGIVDVEDCSAVVKYLSKQGLVDPKRAAIRGGSAGGFTVLAATTSNDDVFKAGASHYGVGDLMLLAQETHKFESRYLDRLIGPLPQAKQIYHDRSPINHLDKMNAGIIFFQGLDDKVVPPSQANTMVKAMKDKGLPVAHYEFKGEAHGFRMSATRKRVLELELSFYGKMFGFDAPGLSEKVKLEDNNKQQPGDTTARSQPKP